MTEAMMIHDAVPEEGGPDQTATANMATSDGDQVTTGVVVRDYETGDVLPGIADSLLIRASRRAAPVGAVSAFCVRETVVGHGLADVWYHCVPGREDDMRRAGYEVRTVYTEAT